MSSLWCRSQFSWSIVYCMLKNWTEYSSSYAIVGSSLFFFIVVAVKIDLECQILSQVGRKHCCAAIWTIDLGRRLGEEGLMHLHFWKWMVKTCEDHYCTVSKIYKISGKQIVWSLECLGWKKMTGVGKRHTWLKPKSNVCYFLLGAFVFQDQDFAAGVVSWLDGSKSSKGNEDFYMDVPNVCADRA